MQSLFEYLPLIAFFAIYKFVDIYWATASLIGTSALLVAFHYFKHKSVPKRHLVFFGIALVFGSLTLIFRDDTFIKWKVTVVNGIFALGLLISQYAFKKNLIKEMLGESMPLPDKVWARLSQAWAGFFAFCGALNIYVAYTMSQETWVNFKVFGLLALNLVFAVATIAFVYKYLPDEEKNAESSE